MNSELERTIIHYYPRRALTSPLDDSGVAWDYDPSYATLKALLRDLEKIGSEVRPGTRGRYDISEEIVVDDAVRVQLCYIGPYAAINYGLERDLGDDERELVRGIEKALEKHGIFCLDKSVLEENVPWIQHGTPERRKATVWDCLFVHPEG